MAAYGLVLSTLSLVSRYITTPDGLLHWKDYGGSGRPILLVHGVGGTSANWDAIGPRLARLGHAAAFDLPGFGLSPPARDWELSTHAAAVRAAISELGSSAVLVGNSLGALLSQMVAADHPELVDALVLISPATPPPHVWDRQIHWPSARRMLWQVTPGVGPTVNKRLLRKYTPEKLVRLSLGIVTERPGRVPMDVVESFNKLARARVHFPWASQAIPGTGQSIARFLGKRSRFVAMIRKVKAPTLVLHGLEDKIVRPSWVEWMCHLRPDWELVQMVDTGHVPQLDAPVRTMGILTPWLEALDAERAEASA